jgi:2-methylcitrate dehydratase PrpD
VDREIIDLREKIQGVNIQILRVKQTEGIAVLTEEQNSPAGDPEVKRKKDEVQAKLDALFAKKRDYQARIDAISNQQ